MFARRAQVLLLIGAVLAACLAPGRWADADEFRDPFEPSSHAMFEALRNSIQLRAGQYDLDWTWVAAVAFMESGFDPDARGPGGHIGVMQIAPDTAASVAVAMERIDGADDNIHAGVRYLRFILDKHFSGAGIPADDRMMMTVAAYQAGPLNIEQARGWAATHGLDANRWFGGVDVAVRNLFGDHTVEYVEEVSSYRESFRQYSLAQ